MRVSGSMTRFIGRRRSEASPVMVGVKGWAARTPASSRVVVPEFCASRAVSGAASRPRPAAVDGDRCERAAGLRGQAARWNVTPRRAQAVERGGAIGAGRIVGDPAGARGQAPTATRSDARWTCRRGHEDGPTGAAQGQYALPVQKASGHYTMRLCRACRVNATARDGENARRHRGDARLDPSVRACVIRCSHLTEQPPPVSAA